jgi:hypothetical protein
MLSVVILSVIALGTVVEYSSPDPEIWGSYPTAAWHQKEMVEKMSYTFLGSLADTIPLEHPALKSKQSFRTSKYLLFRDIW